MKRPARLLPLLLLLPLLAAAPAAAKDAPDLATGIRDLASPYLANRIVVGASIGVVKDGKASFYGFGDQVKDLPHAPDRDTVFEIGSISKVFTGILLADLVREGKVRLDQPVQELLPEGVTMPKHGETEVTLLHLARHTSGLPRMPSNFEPGDPKNPYADYGPEKLYAWLKEAKLNTPPGEKSVYSNVSAGLLGHLLARTDGTTYEAMLKERILAPLGMSSTTITLTEDHRRRLAQGYDVALQPAPTWDLGVFEGAGAIRSTARDMLRFVQANLAKDGPLRASLDLAMDERLCWQTGRGRWHNGQTGGYHAFCSLDREKQIGVVVLSNTASMKVDQLGRSLVKLLAGEKVEPAEFRKEVAVDEKVLKEYPGTYRLSPTFVLVITLEDGRLHLQATGQPKVALHAASDTVFFLRIVKAEVHFQRDEDGKVKGLVLHQNGMKMPAPRER